MARPQSQPPSLSLVVGTGFIIRGERGKYVTSKPSYHKACFTNSSEKLSNPLRSHSTALPCCKPLCVGWGGAGGVVGESVGEILLAPLGESPNFFFLALRTSKLWFLQGQPLPAPIHCPCKYVNMAHTLYWSWQTWLPSEDLSVCQTPIPIDFFNKTGDMFQMEQGQVWVGSRFKPEGTLHVFAH